MKKLWIRIGAGVLACLVALGAALWTTYRAQNGKRSDGLYYQACGIRPDARLLTVDGEAVEGEEYLYWLSYACEYLTSNLGSVDWDEELTDGVTYGEYAKADALETVKLFAVIRKLAKENGVELTEEDLARLQEQKDQYAAYYGGEEAYRRQVQLMGVSEAAYDRINSTYLLLDHLTDMAAKPGGSLYPTEEELLAYGEEKGYVTARVLYLPTMGLSGDAAAAQQLLAESYVQRLRELDADGAYQLLGQLAADLGMEVPENDYTFNADTADESIVTAIQALEEGAVSDVLSTESGFYIAIRRPLNTDALAQSRFSDLLVQLRGELPITFSKAYDKLDAGAFYTALLQARKDLAEQFKEAE